MSQITNFDDVEKLLHHVFYNELRVAPEEHPVVFAEAPGSNRAQRERVTQLFFETFNVPALIMVSQASLAMYGAGRTTGLSVLCGESAIWAVPVFEGSAIESASVSIPIGGALLTEYLCGLLNAKGHQFATTAEREIVRDIKEKRAFVAQDFATESVSIHNSTLVVYELPDGRTIELGSERCEIGELMFAPDRAGVACVGLHELVVQSVMRCDADIRRSLLSSIVLSGGTSMLPGLPERLAAEVKGLLAQDIKVGVKVVAMPDRKLAVWTGGSIWGSIAGDAAAVTKDEYDRHGPRVVHRKCW